MLAVRIGEPEQRVVGIARHLPAVALSVQSSSSPVHRQSRTSVCKGEDVISEPSEDPGWGRPRDIALALVAPRIAVRRGQSTTLAGLRVLFLAFSLALVLTSFVVVPVLDAGAESEDGLDPTVAAAAVIVIGLALQVMSQLFSRRARFGSCGSPAQLAGLFRSLFMLRIAFAEMSALLGFVAFFLSGSVIPYAVGVAWTAVGFVRIAPTRRHLERLQDEIALQGCPHQLLVALQSPAGEPESPPPGQ